jgi:hypothetical protein
VSPRPKHPDKQLERLLFREAEEQGWVVTKRPRGYFKLKRPCGSHFTMVHLTPSEQYGRNKRQWLLRETCWKGASR